MANIFVTDEVALVQMMKLHKRQEIMRDVFDTFA